MNTPVTLYLADDHRIVVDGLKLLIGSEASIRIVGYAYDGETAKNEILDRKPDVALIDFSMPGLNGMELISTLRKQVPTRFIILSMYDNPRQIKDAMNGGAYGYILKNVGKQELMKCLTAVIAGETHFPNLPKQKEEQAKAAFTPREIEIVKLIIEGVTTAGIAKELFLSVRTVETHRKNICRKTGTSTTLALSKYIQDNPIEI